MAESERQAARLLQKREAALARDEARWESMSAAAAAEESRLAQKRASGLAAKKNAPSLPFNSITLQYDSTRDGAALRHQDDLVKYRAALRTHHLYSRANGAFNPITGEALRSTQPGPKPSSPLQR